MSPGRELNKGIDWLIGYQDITHTHTHFNFQHSLIRNILVIYQSIGTGHISCPTRPPVPPVLALQRVSVCPPAAAVVTVSS